MLRLPPTQLDPARHIRPYIPSFDRHILNLTAVISVVLRGRGLHPLPDGGKHGVVLR